MLDRLEEFIFSHHLLDPYDKLILAVSGGIDSMVMLHAFLRLKKILSLDLSVIHVNHKIRSDADLDEEFVRETCEQSNLECIFESLEGFSRSSSEEKLRDARYHTFEQVLKNKPGSKLATGHQLDDQIETFMMRLAKGSSLKGLCGIPVRRGPYIRPLLFLCRSEIMDYAKENGVKFRQDYTNRDTSKTRNRIRHELIPVFEKVFGQEFYKGIEKSIDHLAEYYADWSRINSAIIENLIIQEKSGFYIDFINYLALPLLSRQQMIEYCIYRANPVNFKFTAQHFRAFEDFVLNSQTGSQFLAGSVRIIKENARLVIPLETGKLPEMELYPGGNVYMGRNKISLKKVIRHDVIFNNDRNSEYICGDGLEFPLTVRFWEKGDYFHPLGLKGRKKLSDFLIDSKVGLSKKHNIPVVCSEGNIIWVAGMRLDERFVITEDCTEMYQLQMMESE